MDQEPLENILKTLNKYLVESPLELEYISERKVNLCFKNNKSITGIIKKGSSDQINNFMNTMLRVLRQQKTLINLSKVLEITGV